MLSREPASRPLVVASRLPGWLRRVLYCGLVCELLAIGWFSILGGRLQTGLQQAIGVDSPVVHIVAFAVTGLTAFALWWPPFRVGLALLGCAALVELAQLFTPDRESSFLDLLASGTGIVIAGLVLWAAGAFVAPRRRR